jgi:hypothetical protein
LIIVCCNYTPAILYCTVLYYCVDASASLRCRFVFIPPLERTT